MFYLLEDNRIVDSEKLSVRVNEYQDNQYLARDSKNRYVLGKIKKQSENVYDLIEVGDLVKYKTICFGTEYIYTMEIINEDFVYYAKRGCYNILAIYKPNEKGDYIKVWEKKDE